MRTGCVWAQNRQDSTHPYASAIGSKAQLFGLLLMLLLLLTGCAGIVTHSGTQPSTAVFQLSSTSVNFGKVTVGKKVTQSLSISNTGAVAVNIKQATVSNPQFSVSGMSLPMALAAGQSGSFSLDVNPTAAGNLTGTLTVAGDSGSSPVTATLAATAVNSPQPQLSVAPASVNFGTVSTGLKGTSNLTLSNTGSADLTVSLITITGAEFSLSGITTPKTIPSGQSVSATVTFSPTTAGSASGSIAITSNDPTSPTVNLPLSGTGSSTPSGQLSASPLSLSFGSVGTGTTSSKQVVVTNTGNAAVKISALSVSGGGFTVSGLTVPATLNALQSATLTVGYTPATAGSVSGSLTITSDASNSRLAVALSGTGIQAGLSVSPASFNFGSVVNNQTKSQSFTITNTGTAALTITQISATGAGYSVSGLGAPVTIQAGGSAAFSVLFAPTTAGILNGSVSISSNAMSSLTTVPLTGTGVAATVSLSASPSSVSFAGIKAGSSSSQNVTITNNGNSSTTILQITVNAKDFAASGITTPRLLAAGSSVLLNVSFSPTVTENVSGNITLSTSQGTSVVITLSGTSVQPTLTITPSSAAFGNVAVGSSSTQTVQLTNSGTGTLSITQVSITGSGFSSSALTLPISLSARQSQSFNLQFAPASVGAVSGSVTILSNAVNSTATIPLSGAGVTPILLLSFSSTNLSFGNVSTGSSSTQTVTVTNKGNANVQISGITASGTGFTLSGASTPVTLSSSQSLTFSVIFSPTVVGTLGGTVTVTSNATGSPATITLSGSGVQPTPHTVALSWTASTSIVSGYNVYRSTTSGTGYSKINSGLVTGLSFTDSAVQSATTYYYVTTAVNASGAESTYSNQATATIP